MSEPCTRVVIIENYIPLATLLVEILGRETDLQVVGAVQSFGDAIPLLADLKPAVAVLDWHLPDVCGLETARWMRVRFPSIRLILLNDEDEHRYSDVALEQGATACICKSLVATDLVPAIKKIAGNPSSLR